MVRLLLVRYISETFEIDIQNLGWFIVLPYVSSLIGANISGLLADYLIVTRKQPVVQVRRFITVLAMAGPAIFALLITQVSNSVEYNVDCVLKIVLEIHWFL
jgi:hypothetical protein